MSQADKRPSVAIIGAGIAGCSLAYELSKYDCDVTLIDGKQIGSGAFGRAQSNASSVPVALLNPHRGRTARASELDKAGLKSMRELKAELESLGFDSGMHKVGILRIASSARQAKLWQKLDDVKWLEPSHIPGVYHAPFGGLLVEDGGYVEPSKLLNALITVAKQHGVKVLEGYSVEKIEKDGLGFSLLVSLSPPLPLFDFVFLCPGASKTFTANLGLEYNAGDVIALESDVVLPHPIAGAIYGASHEGVF